jgi:hypothetical protein
MRYSIHKTRVTISLVITLLITAGCGGGGGTFAGGGIGGTGIIATGSITGFGSVFVNGIEFETGGTRFDVDDDDMAVEADLGIGMVVTVTGTLNDDGVTGAADSIKYDDEIEGPISNLSEDAALQAKMFTIFDITVVATRGSTVFANTSYASVAEDDVVEVSGFFDQAGTLLATRLEDKGPLGPGTEVELKGTVSGCAGDCAGAFNIGSIDISYDGSTNLTEVPGGVISDGQFVEVKGTLTGATSITATRIELEDEGIGDTGDNKVSIEGLVSGFSSIDSFKVAGQAVDATNAVFMPASLATGLADGVEIEVEGPIVSGVLQAVKVEARGGEIRINARVQSTNVAAGSITLVLNPGNLTLTIDSQTALRDETGAGESLALADIIAGDFLEAEAYEDDSGDLIATEVRRDALDDEVLQGPIDSCTGAEATILGLSYTLVDGLTNYQDQNENPLLNGNDFCTAQAAGGFFVKIKDERAVDGVADEAELKN